MGVHRVKAMAFTVVVYGYESWTIKKAEHLQNQSGKVRSHQPPINIFL